MPGSQVRAKQPSHSLVQGLLGQPAWGSEKRQGEAGAAQPCWGWEPPSSTSGAQLGQGAAVGTPVPAMAPALQGLQPCPSGRQGGTEQPLGPMLQAESPAEVLMPGAIGSVPAACVLCHRTEADPDICGDKLEKFGLCAHMFCLVSGCWALSLQHCNGHAMPLSSHLPLHSSAVFCNSASSTRK